MSKAYNEEEILISNIKKKASLSHFKKVLKDDLAAFSDYGFWNFLGRWLKRLAELALIPTVIGYLLKEVVHSIVPIGIRRKVLRSKLNRNRESIDKIQVIRRSSIVSLKKTLSVIVNTKNSPSFFREIIEKYSKQIGFQKVEVIVVDSGSIDNTLDIAKEFGCKIVKIKPEEFRHGRSRNIGISLASGDYIINTVSDAIPATLDLAYKVAKKLEEKSAVAVSVRQIPRFDADLFAVWSIWQHYKYIFGELNKDVWVENLENFDSLKKEDKRKFAIIDDVFVMHKGEVIKKEKYDNNIRYAEDLLLSINYLRKGYKIGILQSEAVIHSHSRVEEYFFKRYFVDANVINEVFNIMPNNLTKKNFTLEEVQTENRLYSIIAMVKENLKENQSTNNWIDEYLEFFNKNMKINKDIRQTWSSLYKEILLNFEIFTSRAGGFVDGVQDCRSRIAAMTSGTLLSEYLIRYSSKKKLPTKLKEFKAFMEGGI